MSPPSRLTRARATLAALAALLLLAVTTSPAQALSPVRRFARPLIPSGQRIPQNSVLDATIPSSCARAEQPTSPLMLFDDAGQPIPAKVVPSPRCPARKPEVKGAFNPISSPCEWPRIIPRKPLPVGRITLRYQCGARKVAEGAPPAAAWQTAATYTVVKGKDRGKPRFSGKVRAVVMTPGLKGAPPPRVRLSFAAPKDAYPKTLSYQLQCGKTPALPFAARADGEGTLAAELYAHTPGAPRPDATCTILATDAAGNTGRSTTFRWPIPAQKRAAQPNASR